MTQWIKRRKRRVTVKSFMVRGHRGWEVTCGGCHRRWQYPAWWKAMAKARTVSGDCCKSLADTWLALPARRVGPLPAKRPERPTGRIDLWNTPTTSSGRFTEAKRSGDIFRGARRED